MATIKDLLSSMISKINSKISTWEEIPDKPFGTKTEMVEIVAKKKVENFLTSDNKSFTTIIASNVSLEIGKTYKVLFNDKEYIAECYDDSGYKTIGTPYGAEYTDYPFNICANGNTLEMIKGTGDDCTFALYEVQETVKQLDPKFIGVGAGRGFDMIIGGNSRGGGYYLIYGDYNTVKEQLNKHKFALICIASYSNESEFSHIIGRFIELEEDLICVYDYAYSTRYEVHPDNTVIGVSIG